MRTLMPLVLLALVLCSAARAAPVKLIFDTDMGNDIDDAFALAMIHALQSRGECELLAVTVCKDNDHAAPFCDLVNTWYGRPGIPVGAIRGGKTPEDSAFIRVPNEARDGGKLRYPHKLRSGKDAPEAVALTRRVLARQPDASVVFVSVGFSSNLARLLQSGPDAASPLSGRDLVAAKARLWVTMAGDYRTRDRIAEYNVAVDRDAAAIAFAGWPTPVVASGFDIGLAVSVSAHHVAHDYAYATHHPIYEASWAYHGNKVEGRPAWDPTAVLYAVRPDHGYFGLSEPGAMSVDPKGFTDFKPDAAGKHRYLKANSEQVARAREAVEQLASQPPDRRRR